MKIKKINRVIGAYINYNSTGIDTNKMTIKYLIKKKSLLKTVHER